MPSLALPVPAIQTPFSQPPQIFGLRDGKYLGPASYEGYYQTPAFVIGRDGHFRARAGVVDDPREALAVEAAAERHPTNFAVATCTDDVEGLRNSGIVALALGVENASPLEGSAEALDHFAARGIRYVSLAHSKSNRYADSSYDLDERWGGLSELGKRTVAELNRRRVM